MSFRSSADQKHKRTALPSTSRDSFMKFADARNRRQVTWGYDIWRRRLQGFNCGGGGGELL